MSILVLCIFIAVVILAIIAPKPTGWAAIGVLALGLLLQLLIGPRAFLD